MNNIFFKIGTKTTAWGSSLFTGGLLGESAYADRRGPAAVPIAPGIVLDLEVDAGYEHPVCVMKVGTCVIVLTDESQRTVLLVEMIG